MPWCLGTMSWYLRHFEPQIVRACAAFFTGVNLTDLSERIVVANATSRTNLGQLVPTILLCPGAVLKQIMPHLSFQS